MLLIRDNEVIGSSAWNSERDNPYISMKPWQHKCGANIWVISEYGVTFVDDDDAIYILRKRVEAEIQETSEYKIWKKLQPLSKIYLTLNVTGGDNKIPPGIVIDNSEKKYLNFKGWIGFDPLNIQTKIPISYSWRITICKVRSELNPVVIDSIVCNIPITNGEIDITNFTLDTIGIYMISDKDFDVINGQMFGVSENYQVVFVGEDKFFKVYLE